MFIYTNTKKRRVTQRCHICVTQSLPYNGFKSSMVNIGDSIVHSNVNKGSESPRGHTPWHTFGISKQAYSLAQTFGISMHTYPFAHKTKYPRVLLLGAHIRNIQAGLLFGAHILNSRIGQFFDTQIRNIRSGIFFWHTNLNPPLFVSVKVA
jgi:hypothetical protein